MSDGYLGIPNVSDKPPAADSEVIFLSGTHAAAIALLLTAGRTPGARIMIQDGGIKVCPSGSSWSLPFGTNDEMKLYD